MSVVLGELADDAGSAQSTDAQAESAAIGLSVSSLNPRVRQEYDVSEKVRDGVVITNVDRGGRGARAGLRIGDVIVELNRKPVKSADDFMARVDKSKGIVLLLVRRDAMTLFVALTK